MEQPQGFEFKSHPIHVCKLKETLYGLKQAPRAWYGKIAEFLLINDFAMAPADSSLYMKFKVKNWQLCWFMLMILSLQEMTHRKLTKLKRYYLCIFK